jgi:hypothetical protein
VFIPSNHQNSASLNASADDKAAWERQAAEVFIQWYNEKFEDQLTFIRNNQPAKPDVSCMLNNKRVDIEIAHLYGTEQEAMSILGKALSEHTKSALALLKESSTAEQRLLKALNRILEQKSHKHYDSSHTWLVIRNAHPRWNAEKIKAVGDKIVFSQSHPFEQIWIVGDLHAQSGVVRIPVE